MLRKKSDKRCTALERHRVQSISAAVRNTPFMEMLERRVMLSVSGATLLRGFFVTGAEFNYTLTSSTSDTSAFETYNTIGPETAPTGGQSASEVDVTLEYNGSEKSLDQNYFGNTSAGVVEYEDVSTDTANDSTSSDDDTYSPPELIVPTTLDIGQEYDSDTTDTDNYSDGDPADNQTSTSDEDDALTLGAETTITVPAGTFNVYPLNDTSTTTDYNADGSVADSNTSSAVIYLAPNIGIIEEVSSDVTETLTSYNLGGDTLSFPSAPADTVAGQTMAPVKVQLLFPDGTVDTDSDAPVTLTLQGGDGTLGGTTTVDAVDGVATFSDLSVSKSGDYTFVASSSQDGTGTTGSPEFKITGDHLVFTTEPSDSELNAPIPMAVTVEDQNNAVDTDADGTIDLSLNTVSGGDNAMLGGTISVDIVNGVGTFTSEAGPNINVAGTYTLTATQMDTDPDTGEPAPVDTTAPGTSDQFTVTNSLIWSGAGDGVNWSDPKNWKQDAAPVDGASLLFPTGAPLTSNNDIAGLSIDDIDIQGGGYNLTGNAISLTDGLTSEAGNNTYNIDTTLVGSPTLDDVTGDLTIASVFSGDSLTISGDGIDTFDQTDTYTGTTTLSAGVTIDDDALTGALGTGALTIGSGSAPVTIDDGGSGAANLSNDVTLEDGSTLDTDPTVVFKGQFTVNGTVTLNPVGASDQDTISGPIVGTGTLITGGKGIVEIDGDVGAGVQLQVMSGEMDLGGNLKGTSGNLQVSVQAGTLQLLGTITGTGGIDVQGGTLKSSGATGYSGTVQLEESESSGAIILTPNTTELGTGKLVIATPSSNPFNTPVIESSSDAALTLSNPVEFQAGSSLTLTGDTTVSGQITLDGDASLDTNTASDSLALNGGMTGTGTLTLGGPGTITVNGDIGPTVVLAESDGEVDLAGNLTAAVSDSSFQVLLKGGTLQLLGTITGTGGIDVQGGTLKSSGATGYSGTVQLEESESSGAIILTPNTTELGTGKLVIATPSSNPFNTPVIESSSDAALTLSNPVEFQAGSSLTLTGDTTVSGQITLDGDASLDTNTASDSLALNGGMTGTGTLTLGGPGTITVNGDIGPTVVLAESDGEVDLAGNLTAAVSDSSFQVLLKGGTLQLLGTITGTGGIDVQGGTLKSSGATGYSGTVQLEESESSGAIILTPNTTELGTGKLVIATPSSNPFNTPVIESSSDAALTLSNPVEFQAGSSLTLTGDTTVSGQITLDGDASLDTNTASDSLALNGGMTGTGTLTLGGPGTITVNGDIGPTVVLAESDGEVDLAGNLTAAVSDSSFQVLLKGGTLQLLGTITGTGGIDVQGGTLKSSGATGYSGTVQLEESESSGAIILTPNTTELGTGKLVIATPSSNPFNTPVIESSSDAALTLSNPVEFQAGSSLTLTGDTTVSGQITLDGDASLDTNTASDSLALNGGMTGTGTLTLGGPGTITVNGDIGPTVVLAESDGEVDLAGNLTAAVSDSSFQVLLKGGTLQLLGTITGTGGIDVQGGTLKSSGATGYSGTVQLEESESSGAIILTPNTTELGTGKLVIATPSSNPFNTPVIESSSDAALTLSNPVEFQAGSSLTLTGDTTVSGQITLDGDASLDTNTASDSLALNGGMTGTGTLTLGGPGTITVNGDIGPTVVLAESDGEVDLAGNLTAAVSDSSFQVLLKGGTLQLLGTITGTGGIDVQGGTLKSSGATGYSGTVQLEESESSGAIILTPNTTELGTGKLVIATPSSNPFNTPVIESSSDAALTLSNPVEFQAGSSLTLTGDTTVSGQITLDGDASLDTNTASDSLALNGGMTGTGTLTLGGPGTITVNGDIGPTVVLAESDGEVDLAGNLTAAVSDSSFQVLLKGGTLQLLGTITGTGGIDVQGGTLKSSGATGYSGNITLEDGGTIKDAAIGDLLALGTGTLTLNGGTLQNTAIGMAILSNPVSVIGTSNISSRGQKFKFTDSVNLAGSGSIDIFGTVALTGSISGSGDIIMDGDELDVGGSNPSFTGNVTVHSGTIEVVQDDALGNGNLVADLESQGVLESVSSVDPVLDNPLTVQTGTLILEGQFTFPSGVTIDSNANLGLQGAGTQVVVSGPLAGGGDVETGGESFTPTGSTTGFTGAIDGKSSNPSGGSTNPTTVPNGPFGLVALGLSSTEINLYWHSNSSNESGFAVERSSDGGSFTVVATLPAGTTTYPDTDLDPSTTYQYRVRAFNSMGNSSYTGVAMATTLTSGATAIPAPVGTPTSVPNGPFALSTTPYGSTQINLTWHDNANNEAGYAVERSEGTSDVWTVIMLLPADSTFYFDTTLAPATQYIYRVRAFNALGDSSYAGPSSTSTLPGGSTARTPISTPPSVTTVPNGPFALSAQVISATQIDLAWHDNSDDADGYLLERQTGDGDFEPLANLAPDSVSFTDDTVTAGNTYTYRLFAFNDFGDSSIATSVGVSA